MVGQLGVDAGYDLVHGGPRRDLHGSPRQLAGPLENRLGGGKVEQHPLGPSQIASGEVGDAGQGHIQAACPVRDDCYRPSDLETALLYRIPVEDHLAFTLWVDAFDRETAGLGCAFGGRGDVGHEGGGS